jgi:hypothetical protein
MDHRGEPVMPNTNSGRELMCPVSPKHMGPDGQLGSGS